MKISHHSEHSWIPWLIRVVVGLGLAIGATLWLLPLAYAQRGYRAMGGEILLILFLFFLPLCLPSLHK